MRVFGGAAVLLGVVFLLGACSASASSASAASSASDSGAASASTGDEAPGNAAADPSASPRLEATSVIWSQNVSFTMPNNFVVRYENTNGPAYIREAVPRGETVDNWTEMITVTGARDAASQAGATPERFAETIAGGFKKACPDSFNAKSIGNVKTSGYDSFEAIMSCGTSPTTGGKTSETAAVLVIAGKKDIYTLQYAVRSEPSAGPMDLDVSAWEARLARLQPIAIE